MEPIASYLNIKRKWCFTHLGFHKNQKGFISTLLLLNLTLILVLVIFTVSLLSYKNQRLGQNEICLDLLQQIQKKTVFTVQSLQALNPAIKSLRLQRKIAQLQRNVALAAQNYALAAKLQTEIIKYTTWLYEIYKVQKQLHLDYEIASGRLRIQSLSNFKTFNAKYKSTWEKFIFYQDSVQIIHWPRLGLIPDSSEVPPIYELSARPSHDHRLSLLLHNQFKILKTLDQTTTAETFLDSCQGTSRMKENKWIIEINAGKF